MGLEAFIVNYGYIIILVGTFLEGETIVVMAGFLAHRGYLAFPLVVIAALAGTFAGDQLYFFIGRRKGMRYLETRPSWKMKSERVVRLIQRHQTLVILLFRFIYGARTITPFLIGASRVRPVKFIFLNALGGLAWALAVAGLGYTFGQAAEILLHDIKRYETILMGVIVLAGLLAWSAYLTAAKLREK